VNVRPATPGDAREIARVFTESRANAMPWLPVIHRPEEVEAYFRDVVPASASLAVAEDARRIVGFVAFTRSEIEHLYVAPGAQRRGVGRQLLAVALGGAHTVHLWVFQRNASARAFYERHGFRLERLSDGARNEEREPDARYVWEFGAR
jgi:ribosomal protein S18 acetylase RimI-like enzyme